MSKRLRDIIAELESTDASLCIVAKRPWQPDSEALLVRLTEDYRVPRDTLAQGYEYFLEVSVALDEVLNDLGSVLSIEQRMRAVLYYAEHDAYPEWLSNLRNPYRG
ncbi:DUF7716 domain-containing protein [Piscinibacter defluvii]|uniref:DUF7716 domain-containing protein n=1 Tax=Piscinibacter defluvii TaxID=1796922 RepID=UPI000FDE9B3D|nr:hypothetical protein [Piscinibacter defluvii]